jgi:hypothetical protein
MPFLERRRGKATRFDIFNNSTGAVVARNIDAATVIQSATSLTAQNVIDRVAAEHQVVSDGYFIAAHPGPGLY